MAISAAITLGAVAFGAYAVGNGFNGAQEARNQICSHMDLLVKIERERIVRARTATVKEDYYLAHPDELHAYVERSRKAISDLGKVDC